MLHTAYSGEKARRESGALALMGAGKPISAAQAAQLAALEEEVVRNVEEAVKVKVEELMQSEEVQARIQVGCRGGVS